MGQLAQSFESIIGERVKARRIELGISQQRVSDKTGLSLNSIRALEMGRTSVRIGNLQKIARALDISVSDLTARTWS